MTFSSSESSGLFLSSSAVSPAATRSKGTTEGVEGTVRDCRPPLRPPPSRPRTLLDLICCSVGVSKTTWLGLGLGLAKRSQMGGFEGG